MSDNELQHFGVPGMKWGRRKGGSGGSTGPTGKQVRKAAAVQRIDNSGGSKFKAAAKETGKAWAKSFAAQAGAMAVGKLTGSPALGRGAQLAANAISADVSIRNMNRVYNIVKA